MATLGDFLVQMKSPVTIEIDSNGQVQAEDGSGKVLGPLGAEFVFEVVRSSMCDLVEDESSEGSGSRHVLKTRIHDSGSTLTEPLSTLITHRAIDRNNPRPIPKVLHTPRSTNSLVKLLEAAEAEGAAFERFAFSMPE